jgi:Winged helix-turn helix
MTKTLTHLYQSYIEITPSVAPLRLLVTMPGMSGHIERNTHLEPFLFGAQRGQILVVTDIKAAYEAKVGRKVPKSTVYRMLERHGWRKIAPRPHHPKTDPLAQEAFKKTSR